MDSIFVDELREAIASSGKSQREIAEMIGVPLPTLESWVRGIRKPKELTQRAMLDRINALHSVQVKRIGLFASGVSLMSLRVIDGRYTMIYGLLGGSSPRENWARLTNIKGKEVSPEYVSKTKWYTMAESRIIAEFTYGVPKDVEWMIDLDGTTV
ncbi:MAG: helix-turn-helix transcriptional regulator [Clostridia bacterium]|nr:helix-turn-helix transcriptional regulator [Clostridia bacterium]